ncbi:unnamed protein product, partial [Coregonus sp. 'balchen']
MTAQSSKTVLSLDSEAVRSLKDGINFKKSPDDGKCYIIYKENGELKACKNQCKHQGGLRRDDGRGWSSARGGDRLGPLDPQELQEREVTVTYLTHACMELQLGGKKMIFDPWLTGPAFARGWWLLHEPPADSMERLMLEKRQLQLTNINVVPFGVWQNIDEHLRFMILKDEVHPEMDTCIIVEYKGHMILNTVDCTRPNYGRLPHNVDLMMSDFAGGASGFPMTFSGGKYTESWKADFIKNERKKLMNYKAQLIKSLQPKIYCPFAGYFVEAHPSDRYIKDTNTKNNAEELNALIKKSAPGIATWTPKPGAVLDLALALMSPS